MINKKFFTLFAISLLLLGVGLSFVFSTLQINSYLVDEIVLHFDYDEEYVLDKEQMNQLEEQADAVLTEQEQWENTNNISTFEDPVDPTDPTEPDTTTSVVFEDQTTKELTAEWITVGFLQYALTGTIEGPTGVGEEQQEGYILNPGDDVNSWITPDVSDYYLLYRYAVAAKFFSETVLNPAGIMYANEYIATFGRKYYAIGNSAYDEGYLDPFYKDIWDDDSSILDDSNDTLLLMSQTIEYQLDIATFVYVYAYLWQYSSNDKYDYILTSWMNQRRYAIYWVANVSSTIWFTNEAGENGWFDSDEDFANNWNSFDHSEYASVNPNQRVVDNGTYGFNGLIAKNDSTLSVDSTNFWSYSNVWDYSDPYQTYHDPENDQKFLAPNPYQENKSYYVQSTDDTTAETTTNMYMYSLLYPFAFPDDTLNSNDEAENWYYSLNAYYDPSDDPNLYYKDPAEGLQQISWFELINQTSPYQTDFVQILLIYAMYHHSDTDKQQLESSAYAYWYDRGYYIELSGKYQEDYGSLIPEGLIKK